MRAANSGFSATNIFRDSKAGMVPFTLGMCRYISHSEIVCRGPRKFENPWSRVC